jgi:hypothetical protein
LRALATVIAGMIALSTSASVFAASPSAPRAFQRPATAEDRLPSRFTALFQAIASRRVATYVAPHRPARRAAVFVIRDKNRGWCVLTAQPASVGAGCGRFLFAGGGFITAGEGKFLAGVAANDVTRVVVVGSRGVRHVVPRDKGFVYDCRAHNGCACLVNRIEAYGGSGLLESQPWVPCRRSS